ncbi:MAG: protein-L-isoaspartate O-methyltransferase [Proteobacteria bacterium]|nr:protein-L-isoaspartate O-methyltransferase [Pseudomonadota bacterium]
MNIEEARINMLKQQVRATDVLDDTILECIERIPREFFVPKEYLNFAFADFRVPIEHGQEMMKPLEEGNILQALAIKPSDKVLEIGTGTGYFTALLANLSQHVYSIDIFSEFTQHASAKLKKLNLKNVTLETGNAARGWASHGPYDVVIISGSLSFLPKQFRETLNNDGRLFAVIGESQAMNGIMLHKVSEKKWHEKYLFETNVVRLIDAPHREEFVF